MTTQIYWKHDEQFQRQQALLEKEHISNRNKELIKQFQNHRFAIGAKQARVAKLTWGLRKICRDLNIDLDKTSKTDIERFVGQLNQDTAYTDNTKTDYRRCLKQFYKWFEDEDPRLRNGDAEGRQTALELYKYLRKYVKTTTPQSKHDPGEVITDDEIQDVIEHGCHSDLERAFLKVLHETGCRIGELLSLRIKDIQQREPLWALMVDGKTGERPVFIRYSIPYLLRWLDSHPQKNDPGAPLWVSLNNRFYNKPFRYIGAVRLINRCCKRAGLTKKHNPHWFRHSRASLDAPHYSESIRNHKMGWVEGSGMSRRYTHMSGTAVEEAMKEKMGLKTKQEEETEPQPTKCRICATTNPPTGRFCWKCGTGITTEAAIKQQEYLAKAWEILPRLLANPQLRKAYEERIG